MPIPISAFPYTFDMVAAHAGGSSAGAVANADGQNILSNTGGWDNGPWSRIVPPSVEEIYCGFGNFFFPANTTRFNVRCMIRAGNELYRTTGSKMIIGNLVAGASGDRAMGISAEGTSPHEFTHWTHASRNINSVGNPATYPDAGPFHFASSSIPKSSGNYQGEWVCYEFEAIVGGEVRVYIHTQDGVVAKGPSDPFSSSAYPVAGTFYSFALGWYWGPNQGSYPGLYLDIGDVVVSDQYIGPPTGFLSGAYIPMAFPSSAGAKDSLANVFTRVQHAAARVKSLCSDLNTRAAAGNVSAKDFMELATYLADARQVFVASRTVPGIGPFAQEQCNDPALDIAAEFTAMMSALDTALASIVSGFPKDGSGYLLYTTFDANGRYVYRQLNPAQTAAIRTNLTALVAAIN